MWVRVKGRRENALKRLPFKAVYLFRPGAVQPLDGIRSKSRTSQLFYDLAGALLTGLRHLAPAFVLTLRESAHERPVTNAHAPE